MGVPGLWDVLRPTGEARSLLDLAVKSGFVENNNGHRAYRIGIDASIWFFHAQGGREGENPELRTLFFRCSRLLAMPFLAIFVFDGPKRPKIKRGKAIGGGEHWMINSLRTVLDAFGFECRTAPGEAEAELAYLNRIGVIDAVLSDDVDCFIFGAQTVIRNSSATLSGNRAHGARNLGGKGDGYHAYVYHQEHLKSNPDVSLTEGGLILIALLRGGDYDQRGIEGCGVNTAHALARAGFGDTLLAAARASKPDALSALLPTWRIALRHELATNASGFAARKSPTLAKRITETFPPLDVLKCYTHPITSECESGPRGVDGLWRKRADVAKIARVCEKFFEWGMEATVIKRFRSFLWPGAVLRTLVYLALENDKEQGFTVSRTQGETPSKALARTLGGMTLSHHGDNDFQLIVAIRGERRHTSTDNLLEYRLEIDPRQLVAHARTGIQGTRVETVDSAAVDIDSEEDEGEGEDGGKKKRGAKNAPPDPDSTLRVWMPAVMVEYAYPDLVKDFVESEAAKEARKAKKTNKGAAATPTKKHRKAKPQEEDGMSTPTKSLVKSRAKPEAKASKTYQAQSRKREPDSPIVMFKNKGKGRAPPVESTTSNARSSLTKSPVQVPDDDLVGPSSSLTPVKSKSKEKGKGTSTSTIGSLPMAIDDVFMVSMLHPCSSPSRTRKHSIHSTSSNDSDAEPSVCSPKKSPRKTVDNSSPRKSHRPSSPSPLRPLMAPKMRPLHMAMARSIATTATVPNDEDIIIISSDSEEDITLSRLKASAKPRVTNKTKESLFQCDLNLRLEIIDLT